MIPLWRERQHGDRRAHARGGRGGTDAPGLAATVPSCPACAGASSEVGEFDGGWWFICTECDLLWNERECTHTSATPVIDAVPSPSLPPTLAR